MLATILALAATVAPVPPAWRVDVHASGTYAVDYGLERDLVDGQGSGSWSWDMRALALGPGIDTELTAFRMSAAESSTVLLAGGTPYCRPPAATEVGWVRDERVGLYFDARRRGFQVDEPFGSLLSGCHVGAHGMTLYDGADPVITRIPRRFVPRRDSSFENTWTQTIALDRSHDPGQDAHTFAATGTITIQVRRIGPRAARRLALRLRSTPRTPRA
jgi:hypothetical protein